MERENNVPPCLTSVERHNLIRYFLSKDISLADSGNIGLNKPVLSESTE